MIDLAPEIVWLKLWERLDDATVTELAQPLLAGRRRGVSTPGAQRRALAAFCALFGRLERTVRSDWASPARPEVTVLSNLQNGLGRPIGGSATASCSGTPTSPAC